MKHTELALGILDGMVHRLEHGERIEIADAITIVKFIRLLGVDEHSEQHALLSAIDNALILRKGFDFVRNSRGLIGLLRDHFDNEDTSSLSKEQFANLSQLQGKYTIKPRAFVQAAGLA